MPSIVEQIRQSRNEALTSLYEEYRYEFIRWAKGTYQCNDDDAKDVYQATIIAFYENIVNGKLNELSSSVKTYIFAIGKNKIREMQRKRNKYSPIEETPDVWDKEDDIVDPDLIKTAMLSLDKIGEPCKTLLQEVYYHKSSMALIVAKLGYKNEDAAKSQKYKCLMRLRAIFKDLQVKAEGV